MKAVEMGEKQVPINGGLMKRHFLSGVVLVAVVVSVMLLSQPTTTFAQGATAVPVFRFYFEGDKDVVQKHVYRTVPDVPGDGWQVEGIVFYISPVQLPYTVPLYCLFDASHSWDHFYTIDVGARNNCIVNLGYMDQGVFGYVLPSDKDLPGSTALYRWVRVHHGTPVNFATTGHIYQDHFYQTSASQVAGYNAEGIECRVWTQPLALPQQLLKLSTPAAGSLLQVNQTQVINWKVWSNEGFTRISYTVDDGKSWRPIATVANKGNYGDINDQSYSDWKVPAEAVGKIKIKVDWIAGNEPNKLPWATDTVGPLTVTPLTLRMRRR